MNRVLLLTLISLGLATGSAQAIEPSRASVQTAKATPQKASASQVEFVSKVHDFGTFSEDLGTVSCEFVFKNVGKTPVVINRVAASCGCTTPDWPKEPIAPGKSSKIKTTYSAKNRPGSFNKSVSIYTSDSTTPLVLSIKGVVTPSSKKK
ncbi:MAG: DUF1573 domain-containing protein [Bacteroidales bacterium]